jgi:hypothetical protein
MAEEGRVKGIIFNLLEDVVVDTHGESTWDELLEVTGLEGAYTSLGSYDDGEITALVSAAATKLSLPDGEVLRWFGRRAIPGMAKRWPEFFAAHQTTLPFLLSLNDLIHAEVRKLYSGAYCPYFAFTSSPDGSLMIGYQSQRKLCDLAHGFILGACDYYGEALVVQHRECMHKGADRCLIAVTPA